MSESSDKWPYKPDKETLLSMALTMGLRIGICLPGGGAAGAVQAGMLRALAPLFRLGHVAALSCASVGALNGAMAAQGRFKELWNLWWNLKRRDVYSWWRLAKLGSSSFCGVKGLERLIDEHVNEAAVNSSGIRMFIQACDRETGAPGAWKTGDPNLKQWLMASAALPAIFPQVEINGRWWVDGGVVDNSPMDWLIGECNEILVLHCHPARVPGGPAGQRGRWAMIGHLIRLIYQANQDHDVRAIERRNEDIRSGRMTGHIIAIREVRPEGVELDTLDFKEQKLRAGLVAGYAAGVQLLETLRAKRGELQMH